MYEMAQPASHKRTPLGIEHFSQNPSLDPSLKWEKWQIRLAFLAKEIIVLGTQLGSQIEQVQLPLELIYEDTFKYPEQNQNAKD